MNASTTQRALWMTALLALTLNALAPIAMSAAPETADGAPNVASHSCILDKIVRCALAATHAVYHVVEHWVICLDPLDPVVCYIPV